MDEENRLYYFGCMFLHWVLSAFDYLFEDISSPELTQRYRMGYNQLNTLASWLLDELFSAGDRESITEEEAREVYSQGEAFESLVLGWAERLRIASRNAAQVSSSIDEGTRLYYFACGWALETMYEFDHLLQTVASSELRHRYQENYDWLDNAINWLRNELSSIGGCESVSMSKAESLRTAIEILAKQLAAEWREKVHELAKA